MGGLLGSYEPPSSIFCTLCPYLTACCTEKQSYCTLLHVSRVVHDTVSISFPAMQSYAEYVYVQTLTRHRPATPCPCTVYVMIINMQKFPQQCNLPLQKILVMCLISSEDYVSASLRSVKSGNKTVKYITQVTCWGPRKHSLESNRCTSRLSFSILIPVIGSTPIQAPFEHCVMFSILI